MFMQCWMMVYFLRHRRQGFHHRVISIAVLTGNTRRCCTASVAGSPPGRKGVTGEYLAVTGESLLTRGRVGGAAWPAEQDQDMVSDSVM